MRVEFAAVQELEPSRNNLRGRVRPSQTKCGLYLSCTRMEHSGYLEEVLEHAAGEGKCPAGTGEASQSP